MSDATVSAPLSPFKGLAPFEASELDTLLFFGRERESEIIRANLIASRLTILYGPSGVGKTSLLRAGVAHPLRTYDGAAVVLFSGWSSDPEEGLLAAVEQEVRRVQPEAHPEPAERSLAEAIAAWTAELGAELYVILDQFEEYFLYHETGGPFVGLAELVRRRDVRTNFLISIREDALAQLDVFKAQIPNLFGNSLRLDRLTRDAATRALLGPLERYNELAPAERRVEAEPAVVEEVLDSVVAGRIQLAPSGRGGAENGSVDADLIEAPYLQLVLERLWEVETDGGSNRLRLETLRELGGAARIVEDHLERAMAGLSAEEKDAAAAMYNHLVTPTGTKIAHRTGDLARYAAVDESEASRVLASLAQERIVRAGENGVAGPQYEIFHDVLADAVLAWRARHEAERRLEEERRNAARRHRRLLGAAAALLVAVAVFAGIALYALSQRREARAGELVALAAAALPTDPERSLELALDASRISHSAAIEDILRKTLTAVRAEAVLPLRGAPGEVTLSKDGSRAAGVGGDGVQLYGDRDMAAGQTLRHPQATAAAFSDDGARIVTTGNDRVARLWDARTTRLVRSIAHAGAVQEAAFSRDGRRILTVAEGRTVRVFDIPSGALRARFTQPSLVSAAGFSPRGDLIATGGSDDIARLWNARTGKLRLELRGHAGGVGDVAFSPDGNLVATGSTDGTARVWKTRKTSDGPLVTIHPGHRGYVSQVEFSPDGKSIATASTEGLARVFAAESPTLLATLIGHTEAVTALAFPPLEAILVTASNDRTVRHWDLLRFPELTQIRQDGEPVAAVAFSSDERRILSVGQTDPARPWFTLGRVPAAGRRALEEAGPPTAVALSDDGSTAAAAYEDGAIRIVGAEDGQQRSSVESGGPVSALALSPDGRLVVGGGNDGTVRSWDADSGAFQRDLPAHRGQVTSAAFSHDGAFVVTTSSDRDARLSRTDDGTQVWLESYTGPVSDADFSADDRWVVLAGPGRAGVVNATTGERVLDLDGKDRVLTAAAFSPTGWRIATGGESGAVRAYDCRLCGGVDELVDLAESRLAQLREAP
jgi:WD40 repeat protein